MKARDRHLRVIIGVTLSPRPQYLRVPYEEQGPPSRFPPFASDLCIRRCIHGNFAAIRTSHEGNTRIYPAGHLRGEKQNRVQLNTNCLTSSDINSKTLRKLMLVFFTIIFSSFLFLLSRAILRNISSLSLS